MMFFNFLDFFLFFLEFSSLGQIRTEFGTNFFFFFFPFLGLSLPSFNRNNARMLFFNFPNFFAIFFWNILAQFG